MFMQALLSVEQLQERGWLILSVVTGLCNLQLSSDAALSCGTWFVPSG